MMAIIVSIVESDGLWQMLECMLVAVPCVWVLMQLIEKSICALSCLKLIVK